MYCPECGAKLEDNSVFCGSCGFNIGKMNNEAVNKNIKQQNEISDKTQSSYQSTANFSQTNPQQKVQPVNQVNSHREAQDFTEPQNAEAPKAKKKKSKAPIIVVVLLFVAVIVLSVVGLVVASFMMSPSMKAKTFASNLAEQNWEKVYDMMFDEELDYVTYERFLNTYKETPADIGIDLSANKEYKLAEADTTEYSTVYAISTADETLYFQVVLQEDGFWFFDTYKIALPECVSYTVNLPEGAYFTLDGKTKDNSLYYNVLTGMTEHEIYPLIPGEYELQVWDAEGNCYATYITVFENENSNVLTLTANEIQAEHTLKRAEEYTEKDVEAFFEKMMNTYIYESYESVYLGYEQALTNDLLWVFTPGEYFMDSILPYDGVLENGVYVCEIMTEDEYAEVAEIGCGWNVYNVASLQKKIDDLWGPGKITVADIKGDNDYITSKGYFLSAYCDNITGMFDYYGKIKSCTKNEDGTFTAEAYILRCDLTANKIYDETTGSLLSTAQIIRGTSVNFDSIVSQLKISTKNMSTVKFTFAADNRGIYLVSAEKPEEPENKVGAVTYYSASINMKVNAVGGLNLRAEPNEKSKSLKLIPEKTIVEVVGYSDTVVGWTYIIWGEYEGWVKSSYLVTPSADTNTQPDGPGDWYRVKAEGGLNMRESDIKTSKVVTLIPDKSMVRFIEYNLDGSWAYVSYNEEYYGWVNTAYIIYEYSTTNY